MRSAAGAVLVHRIPGRATLIGAVVVALVASVAAGCSAPPSSSPPTVPIRASTLPAADVTVPPTVLSTVPVTVPPESVKIGFLGAGPGAPVGPASLLSPAVEDGLRLAVSQFTSDHPDIVVSIEGPSPGPAGAVAAQRLVADGVVAVIGPQTSAEVGAALPVLNAAGIPAITVTATAGALDVAGWTSFFRAVADDPQQGIDAAVELVTSLHLTSLAVVAGDDGEAQTRTAWVASEAAQLGAAVVDSTTVSTAPAASAEARLAVSSGVGGVYFSGPDPLARSLVADLIGDGYQGAILISSAFASSVLAPLGSTADGVYVASPAEDPAAVAAHGGAGLVFSDSYRAAFGSSPPVWSAEAYDATNLVLRAVAAGAATGPTVAAYLFNHPSTGVSGLLSFDGDGDEAHPPVFVSRIDNGVAVPLATISSPSA